MIDLLVTEEIKEKLEENPEKAAEIINSTDEIGICVTDADKNFAAVNSAYCDLYGYSREELIGYKFTKIVPDNLKEQMEHLHDKFMKDKREIARNWTVQTKNGPIEISVDTAYTDKAFGGPHKITFVSKED